MQFQSALPRGERHLLCLCRHLSSEFQSALPRGERQFPGLLLPGNGKFQSALPRGERLTSIFTSYGCALFQSALPRGERRYSGNIQIPTGDFNPRSHEGSDPVTQSHFLLRIISIRAPTRGATCYVHFFPVIRQFQSALPRGERLRYRTVI